MMWVRRHNGSETREEVVEGRIQARGEESASQSRTMQMRERMDSGLI